MKFHSSSNVAVSVSTAFLAWFMICSCCCVLFSNNDNTEAVASYGFVRADDTDNGVIVTVPPEMPTEAPSDVSTTSSSDEDTVDVDGSNDTISEEILAKKYVAAPDGRGIFGEYLVVYNKTRITEVKEAIKEYASLNGIDITGAYESLKYAKINCLEKFGGDENITAAKAKCLSILKTIIESDKVLFVEEDTTISLLQNETSPSVNATANATYSEFTLNQEFPPWGLDRIDQTNLPLNNQYHTDSSGDGVTAFILDTGILPTHEEFGDRATCPYSAIAGEDCTDGNGHGTHVAGTIGGTNYGVAKLVELVGIKVLSNEGAGSNSAVMAGMDYILAQKASNPSAKYVVNLSLGGTISPAMDNAVNELIAAGVFVAVAAGNSDVDACTTSPARAKAAMTVASSDVNDRRSSFSNWGSCVQIFAPGSDIKSSWYTSNTATKIISGTSMATPHVAGVAALYLSSNDGKAITPEKLYESIVNDGVTGVISDVSGTPNVLLNMEALFITAPQSPPEGSGAFPIDTTMFFRTIVAAVGVVWLCF